MTNLEKLAIELEKNKINYYTTKTKLIIKSDYEVKIGLQGMASDLFQVFITAEGLESIILDDIEEIGFGYANNEYPQLYFFNAKSHSMVARMRLK